MRKKTLYYNYKKRFLVENCFLGNYGKCVYFPLEFRTFSRQTISIYPTLWAIFYSMINQQSSQGKRFFYFTFCQHQSWIARIFFSEKHKVYFYFTFWHHPSRTIKVIRNFKVGQHLFQNTRNPFFWKIKRNFFR